MSGIEVTTYYLAMLSPSKRVVPPPREGLQVIHARKPPVRYFRFLYDAVGERHGWVSMKLLSDEKLASIIHADTTEVHVLHVDGSPAGFAELDRRRPQEIELISFGLMPEFIGVGLGKWFLQWTIDKAWSYSPRRLWLHTCTLDHPAALPNYLKAGFVEFKRETSRREQ